MMDTAPDDVEGLRLVKAFFQITNPQDRRIILALAEAAASGSSIAAEALQLLANEAGQR